jgi:predicted nucleic acid-binding protein
MRVEHVVDASILAKVAFYEAGSDDVQNWIESTVHLVAPEFILVEMNSIACRKIKAGQATKEAALQRAVEASLQVEDLDSLSELAGPAIDVAVSSGTSFYDGLYVACALRRSAPLVTADERLVAKLRAADLALTCLTLADL